jgi:hypothetical protein
MAGAITGAAGQPALTPSASKATLPTNYITDFNFLNQYLPDTYEREFERYGNRSINAFLRMVGAEMPTNSDLIKWEEQGRLHTQYTGVTAGAVAAGIQTLDIAAGTCNFRVGQTVMLSSATDNKLIKGVVVTVNAGGATEFTVAPYENGASFTVAVADIVAFVYGSEFRKGSTGMVGSLEADPVIFDNKPIIIKDKYVVAGSDMAQIGWVEVTSENGADGYLWYIKSEHETRLRYDDYLEMAMIEGVPAETGSAALTALNGAAYPAGSTLPNSAGTQGLFDSIENRGNVWSGGNPTALADFDAIIPRECSFC